MHVTECCPHAPFSFPINLALAQPRVVPPSLSAGSGDINHASLPSITADPDARDAQLSAFSALLRADVGQALGVSLKSVTLEGISPAGETRLDWAVWRQWGSGSLNVGVWGMREGGEDLEILDFFLLWWGRGRNP